MAAFSLLSHPDFPPLGVQGLAVSLARSGDELSLSYRIAAPDRVIWPERQPPGRADDLWRATCFELFLRFDDDERYVEFNFSPSSRWAAYAFDGYREGMAPLAMPRAPAIVRTGDGIRVSLDLSGLPHGALAMALTAVVEEEGDTRSYWSLAHPPGAPDFHHPACFAARLPAPEAP